MKWRRLKCVDIFLVENAHTLIMVAACLHNFGILHDNWIDDAPPLRREPLLQEENIEYYNSDEDEEDERRGFEKGVCWLRKCCNRSINLKLNAVY